MQCFCLKRNNSSKQKESGAGVNFDGTHFPGLFLAGLSGADRPAAIGAEMEDHEGNIWVATDAGIDLFRDLPVASFSIKEGLYVFAVHSVVAADDGSVWEAAEGGLQIVRDNSVLAVDRIPGTASPAAYGSFRDHTGRLWFGMGSQLVFYENGQFQVFRKSAGGELIPPQGRIAAFTETVDHELWALAAYTSPVQILGIRNDRLVERIPLTNLGSATSLASDPSGGIWIGLYADKFARYRDGHLKVMSLPADNGEILIHGVFSDSGDTVWIPSDKGLFLWREGALKRLDERNGLPCADIFSVIRDGRGALWLDSNCGLIEINTNEIAKWKSNPRIMVSTKTLGYPGRDASRPGLFQSHVARALDGRLWYTNFAGLSVVVRDDGAGIDSAILVKGRAGHWGLSGMRERAKKIGAQLNIWSQIGAGTELELRIPATVAYLKRQKLSLWQSIKRAVTAERGCQA